MNPLKFKMAMDYLTRVKKVKPDLPDVFPASQAPIPPKKESIETMEAINRFVRDNPRQDMSGGGQAFKLKQLEADYAKFGKGKLDEAAKVLGFKDYADMGGDANANFRRKIKNELTQFGEVMTEAGSRKRSRGASKNTKRTRYSNKIIGRNK